MEFVLVAYYTMNSMYERSAMELKAASDALGIRSFLKAIPDMGGWCKNTDYKPVFVRDCMAAFPECDIVYTDADSIIHRRPELFYEVPEGIDAIIRVQDFPWRKNECLSGTFFLRNNEGCKRMVNLWINKVVSGKTQRSDPSTWEQHRLGEAVAQSGINRMQLPHQYIYFDHIERVEGKVEHPVITHKQFSRMA